MLSKIFIISTFLMLGCNHQKTDIKNTVATLPGEFQLEEGETKHVDELNLDITFMRVISDTRCPEGAQCKQPGSGIVEMEVKAHESQPVIFQLTTSLRPDKSGSKFFQFDGKTISLEKLMPYPTSKNAGKKNYTGIFKIISSTLPNRGDAIPTKAKIEKASTE